MLGIKEKYNQFKKSTYFTGGKFVIYSLGIYLAATFAVGCLGLIIGFPLLTFPLAMLISHPVIWIIMGVVLTAAYKMVVEPLFHLAKNYINGKRASKGEKSEEKDTELQDLQGKTPEKQARPKTPDRDSGILEVNKDSFVYKTNKKEDYKFWLSNFDIIEIARVRYKWEAYRDKKNCKILSEGVFFSCSNTKLLEQELKEYKNKVEREGSDLVFTSIFNLNGNHWVTLVISHDEKSKKFRAYYCDSFGEPLPEEVSSALQKTLEIDNSSIRNSEAKQQKDGDTWNCGIFALENAKKITDMLKAGKSFDKNFDDQLKYELSSDQLIEKRKEFAKALKKDEQSRAGTPDSKNSDVSSESGISLDDKEFCEDWPTLVHQTNRGNYAYWLDNNDITHIARVVYGYSQSEHSDNNIYFLAPGYSNGMSKFTEKCLQDYRDKLKQNNTLIFTSVFHINDNHWTALVIKPDAGDKKFRAYYCDSFGNQLPNNVLNIVEGELLKEKWSLDIASSKVNQQSDGHNCGIFALENARRVTQMLNEGKSFDEIDKKLSEYKFDLNGKRREFAEALMNDEKWKEDLGNGLLCDLSPRTKTSSTSEVQHTGSFCNIT